MKTISPEFSPNVFHHFYFIRRGLKQSIFKFSSHLKGRMMDFGCGSKPYQTLFPATEYIGVDFQNEGHPHDSENIDVFYDGKRLPFPDAHFDSVLSSEVFEHMFNLPEMIREINRVMKEGGRLLVTCPFVWNEHEVPFDYARYTRFALEDLLQKNGFRVIAFEKSGNFVTTTFQIWILYWYTILRKAAGRNVLTRWILKYFIVFPLNVSGLFWNFVLPTNQTLYMNNVLVAEKTSVG